MPQSRTLGLGLLVESAHVWVVSVIAVFVSFLIRPHLSIFGLDPKAEFITKIVDVSAVFTAYALTAITVLPALNDRTAVQRLRKSGQYRTFIGYVAVALYSNAWLVVLGLALKLCLDHVLAHPLRLAPALSAIWWGSCVLAVLSLFRASRLLLKLVVSS